MKAKKMTIGLLVLMAIIICASCILAGNAKPTEVYAEEVAEETVQDDQSIVDTFLTAMRAKYGEQYEVYYNSIIETWGSVEAYLIDKAEQGYIPDKLKDPFLQFCAVMGDTAPIWGTALAVVLVIVTLLFGKRWLKRIRAYLAVVVQELKVFKDTALTLKAQINTIAGVEKKLLGTSAKFDEERKELDEITKETDNEA